MAKTYKRKPKNTAASRQPSRDPKISAGTGFEAMSSFSEEDFMRLRDIMATIAQHSRSLLGQFTPSPHKEPEAIPPQPLFNPWLVADAFQKAAQKLLESPHVLVEQRNEWFMNYLNLLQSIGLDPKVYHNLNVKEKSRDDKRFHHPAWNENPLFRLLKESYLLNSSHLMKTSESIQGLDDKTSQKVQFYTRQLVDALAPTNFAHMNPEVILKTIETKGENLLQGFANYLSDIQRGGGVLDIKKTDLEHFTVGQNIAATPGKVVFENELMQLIQYQPATATVYSRPLLIIPPWINRYYVFDLSPENSFVRWAVGQGLTVFIISWVNPGRAHAKKTFDDYMIQGPLAALDHIRSITQCPTANVVGYCLGGILLSCCLAYLAQKKEKRIESATFFATLIDFKDAGDLTVFIDEKQVRDLETRMQTLGYLDGRTMAESFNLLRSNSLIWSNYVNNYLLSKEHAPHDMLFWNSDTTRLPAASHSFYLRNMYLYNNLIKPGEIELAGVPIDIRQIATPAFFTSTKKDHIAPWPCAYAATRYFKGPITFCLGESGHVAGIFNSPHGHNKYGYWLSDHPSERPQGWLEQATFHQGSWWPEWMKWIRNYSGSMVPSQIIPDESVIEDSPGRYARSI